jgi:hypothetical protein
MKQLFIMVLLAAALASRAADNLPEAGNTNRLLIDLPTVLRLAGAQNLDVQIAQQRVPPGDSFLPLHPARVIAATTI